MLTTFIFLLCKHTQHGATYTCDVEFGCEELNPETNWVLDIGLALDILADVLEQYNMKNLDEVFPNGELTTTEFMAQQIHQDLCERLQKAAGDDGVFAGDICVKLWESHKAWASYAAPVPTEGDEEW
jgi:6-pyruvoyltetrahydropterin/6-carboxytetrahydropterin synthase